MKKSIEYIEANIEKDKKMAWRIVNELTLDRRNQKEKNDDVDMICEIYSSRTKCVAYTYTYKFYKQIKFDEQIQKISIDEANKLFELFDSPSRIFTNKKEWRKYTKELERDNCQK